MWKVLCNTKDSFVLRFARALRANEGNIKAATDTFWEGLTPEQQQQLEVAASCVSAPDYETCNQVKKRSEKRKKKSSERAKCYAFDLVMNNEQEFELVGSNRWGGKKVTNAHYVYLDHPVKEKARQKIEEVMFGDTSGNCMGAYYAFLCNLKRDKVGKGNIVRWNKSFINSITKFIDTLNPKEESSSEEDNSSDSSSDSEDDEKSDDDSSSDDDSEEDGGIQGNNDSNSIEGNNDSNSIQGNGP